MPDGYEIFAGKSETEAWWEAYLAALQGLMADPNFTASPSHYAAEAAEIANTCLADLARFEHGQQTGQAETNEATEPIALEEYKPRMRSPWPWKLECSYIRAQNGSFIARLNNPVTGNGESDGDPTPESIANAGLMEHAPRLFHEAVNFLEDLRKDSAFSDYYMRTSNLRGVLEEIVQCDKNAAKKFDQYVDAYRAFNDPNSSKGAEE